jgi:hypothetical protein
MIRARRASRWTWRRTVGVSKRRAAPRPLQVRHERSRQKARSAEFAAIGMACGLAAFLIANAVAEVVAKPLEVAEQALAAN